MESANGDPKEQNAGRRLGKREGKIHQGAPMPGTAAVMDANAADDPVALSEAIAFRSGRSKKKVNVAFPRHPRRKWRGKTQAGGRGRRSISPGQLERDAVPPGNQRLGAPY